MVRGVTAELVPLLIQPTLKRRISMLRELIRTLVRSWVRTRLRQQRDTHFLLIRDSCDRTDYACLKMRSVTDQKKKKKGRR